MKKRVLALFLALSFAFSNAAVASAADFEELLLEETVEEVASSASTEGSFINEETEIEEGADLQEELILEEASESSTGASDVSETVSSDASAAASSLPENNSEGNIPPSGYRHLDLSVEVENPDLSGYDVTNEDGELVALYAYDEGYKTKTSYVTPNLPPLRNQNPWGTCWAHSSMALAEINLIKQGKYSTNNINLSELHYAYFNYKFVTDPLGGTTGDNNKFIGSGRLLDVGGNLLLSSNVFASWIGAADESTAPYVYDKSQFNDTNGLSSSIAYKDKIHLTDYYLADISSSSQNIDAVKKLIYNNGAVGVSFYSDEAYYDSTHNSFYCSTNYTSNHAVTIVGWDDNFPKENFKTPAPGNGAWIIRNSWTTGDYNTKSYYGYFYMSYYEQSLDSYAFSYVVDNASNYDHNYQYDGGFYSSYVTANAAANVFKTKGKETLEAVSFYTHTPDCNYTIEIYSFNSSTVTNPESGTKLQTITGRTDYAGYYTKKLSSAITFNAGTTFSVVVKLTSSSETPRFACEHTTTSENWFSTTASASAGQSFLKSGSTWTDYGKINHKNVRVKAFTNNADGSSPVTPSDPTPTEPETIDISGAEITSSTNVTVTSGTSIGTVKPTVKYNGKSLSQGSNYTLKYYEGGTEVKSSTAAKYGNTYYISIIGNGKYVGELSNAVTIQVEPKKKAPVKVSSLSVSSITVDYTGSAVDVKNLFSSGKATVKHGNKVLTLSTDYDIELIGSDHTSAGSHQFMIIGRTKDAYQTLQDDVYSYEGTKTCSYTIKGTSIANARVVGLAKKYEYQGTSDLDIGDVSLYIKDGENERELRKGTDYKVSISGKIGNASVVFTGLGGYTGSLKKKITLKAANLKTQKNNGNLEVEVEDATFIKAGAKPKVSVTLNGHQLYEGTDYKLTYKNNKKVADASAKSAPSVTIKGIGKCTGSITEKFSIAPSDFSELEVTVKDVIYKKSGKAGYQLPAAKLTDHGKALTIGKNKDADKILKKSYTYAESTTLANGETRSAGETVKKKDKVLPGTKIAVTLTVKFGRKSPYGESESEDITGYYYVASKSISNASVIMPDSSKLSVKHGTDVAISQSDLKVSAGKVLASSDYEITDVSTKYTSAKAGKVTVKIRGVGIYGGTKTLIFTLKITE